MGMMVAPIPIGPLKRLLLLLMVLEAEGATALVKAIVVAHVVPHVLNHVLIQVEAQAEVH